MVARVVSTTDRCPGVLHAVHAEDGWLMRIRLPGGAIEPAQLAAVATAADGRVRAIDVTSRAGLQLRGIAASEVGAVAAMLTDAGLVPSAAHDRVRNIVASPFAGCDPDEIIDVRPLVRELDARMIAAASLAQLPPKFAVALDGGGRAFPLGRVDLALHAARSDDNVVFAVSVDRATPHFAIAAHHAVDALIAAALAAVELTRHDPAARLRSPEAHAAISEAMRPHVPLPPTLPHAVDTLAAPLGVLAAADPQDVILAPSLPLGRLTGAQAYALADVTRETGASLRFTPWRSILIADIPKLAVADAAASLLRAGLVFDASDGFAGIAACAGLGACFAALADVRADAAALARRVAGVPRQWRVNVAGCSKGCGMRGSADVDLIATAGGYTVLIDGTETARDLGVADALALATCITPAFANGIAR